MSNLHPKYDHEKLTEAHKRLLQSLPFSDLIFRKLFDFLDEQIGVTRCAHDYKLTTHFLAKHGVDFLQHKDFFKKLGGECDCTILTQVEEAFPVDLNEFRRNSNDKDWND